MKSRLFANIFVAAIAASLSTAGCASKRPPDPTSTVSGTLTYRQDVSLSPNAVAYVRLADLSKGTVGGDTVLQQEIHPGAQLPIPFSLNYKEKWINPSHEYTLDVRIVDQGKLLFINDQKQAVITNGHPSTVAMMLETPGRH